MAFPEAGLVRKELSRRTALLLARAGLADVTPADENGWMVRGRGIVGLGVLEDVEVRIAPKIGIRGLLFLLGYARDPKGWRDDLVTVGEHDGLVEAMARSLLSHAERIVARGLLQGYRSTDDVLPVLRGRLREADQLRRHPGVPYPLEVRFDEWTVDILDNQVLKAAARELLRFPLHDATLRQRLVRLHRGVLTDVADVDPKLLRGTWRQTRLNARYESAVALAELVLQGRSVDHLEGGVAAAGFLFPMAKVFEDFTCAALKQALQSHGGTVTMQFPGHLDRDELVDMRPDLVWHASGRFRAVVDAKYKAEKPHGYPNPDVYQMLAYCSSLGIRQGDLLYARGNEQPRTYVMERAGVTVNAWAIALDKQPAEVLAELSALAAALAARDPGAARQAG